MSASHGSIAAKVRAHKEANPSLYCSSPRCLWRTWSNQGHTPCKKHPLAEQKILTTPKPRTLDEITMEAIDRRMDALKRGTAEQWKIVGEWSNDR